MKKFAVLSLLILSFTLTWCGSEEASVVDYNNTLVDLTKSCLTAETKTREAMAQYDWPTTQESLKTANNICLQIQNDISSLGWFDWDTSLQQAILSLINTELEYLKILDSTLSFSTDQTRTPQQELEYLTLQWQLTSLRETAHQQSEMVLKAQNTFSIDHGFTVSQDNILQPSTTNSSL